MVCWTERAIGKVSDKEVNLWVDVFSFSQQLVANQKLILFVRVWEKSSMECFHLLREKKTCEYGVGCNFVSAVGHCCSTFESKILGKNIEYLLKSEFSVRKYLGLCRDVDFH